MSASVTIHYRGKATEMTKAQAAALQAKWKQKGDPPPDCAHAVQLLAYLARPDAGARMGTYYCADCGEEILRPYESYERKSH